VVTEDHLRVFIIIPNRVRHPLFISFLYIPVSMLPAVIGKITYLMRKTWTTGDAEDHRQQHQAVKGTRYDQSEPHAEVVGLEWLVSKESKFYSFD
jgi:hypothetical protein